MTTTNNTIMNTIKENAQVTGRAALMASLKTQVEAVNVLNDKAREKRAEELKNNTVIMSVVSSRGYLGIVAGDIAETIVEPATVVKAEGKDGTKFSAATTTLIGARKAIELAEKYGKENLILYVNDYEARRISGMLNRINKGSNEILTKEEVAHIADPRYAAQYGKPYAAQAKALFIALQNAKGKFKSVRVMSHDSIFGWALRYTNYPLDMEGTKLAFNKGLAAKTYKGRNYTFTLASGFKLNGEHTLVKTNNGALVVGREIKEGSEQETARDLLSIATQSIIVTEAEERNAAIASGAEEVPQEEAADLDFAA